MPRRTGGRQDDDERSLAFALGDYHKFLTAEEAFAAPVDERIASVWPFVVGRVRKFMRSLSARELANFGEDDILTEVWIEIRERDHKYTPELGRYVAFAGPIVGHCLYRIRERARTVESAKNSMCRLKQYDREEKLGQMTDAKRETRECILRTIGGSRQINLETDDMGSTSALDELESREERQKAQDAIMEAIVGLTAYEAVVLGASEGLWGTDKKTMAQVSEEYGRTPGKTRVAKRNAYSKIRRFVEKTGEFSGKEKHAEQNGHVQDGGDPKLGQEPPQVQPDPPLGAYRARKGRSRG